MIKLFGKKPSAAQQSSTGWLADVVKENSTPKAHHDWNLFEEGQLLIDMYDRGDAIVVRSLVAGINPDSLDISLHNDLLTIRGSREDAEEIYDDQFIVRECYWGRFSRSIIVPFPVDIQRIQAQCAQGVVTVILPKQEDDQSIKINDDQGDDESLAWED